MDKAQCDAEVDLLATAAFLLVKNQTEEGSGAPRPNSKNEAKKRKLFEIVKDRNSNPFSPDGTEMIGTESLEST